MKGRDTYGATIFMVAISAALALTATLPADAQTVVTKRIVGYLYTTTNGEGINEIVRLARYEDGTVGDEKTYPTYVRGGANHDAPALGDYDAQGQTQIIGDFLLTADIGAHSISVFKIDQQSGELTLIASVNSYGQKPVSISSTPVAGQPGIFWVAVGNQWDQPTVIYEGDKLRRLPSDQFLTGDLSKPHPSDKDRTIELYRLDNRDGTLTHVRTLDHYSRENGGASQVAFSPDGRKLAVSTWGIPHFLTPDPKVEEMHPSRVYIYDFTDGMVSRRRYFEEPGISGSVGFEWGPHADLLYVTNFSIINAKSNNGLTVLKDGSKQVTKVANYSTGQTNPKDIDEACWSTLNPKKDMLYVVSYVTNVITPFRLDPVSGKVVKRLPLITRGNGYAPSSDSKDVTISSDGKHMYWLGSFESYSVNLYDLASDGSATFKGQYTLAATKEAVGQPGVYDLAGLAQYDLK
jgi:hypothetical protein